MRPDDDAPARAFDHSGEFGHLAEAAHMRLSGALVALPFFEYSQRRGNEGSALRDQFEQRLDARRVQIDLAPYFVTSFATRVIVGEHGLAIFLGFARRR